MKRFLTSCFGLGWLPKAPGTWGSLPVAVIFGLLCQLGTAPAAIAIIMAAIILAASCICVIFAPSVAEELGKKDPGEIVIDEVAGQAVAFLAVLFFSFETFTSGEILIATLLGFLLFRLFDIAKPWPIHSLEKLPSGWGILADDLMAGVYAAIGLFLFYKSGSLNYIGNACFSGDGSSIGIFQSVILGIVQGATEFLPVSSSGHLVLFENIFKFDPETPEMLLFDLTVHVGTLVAIFIVFCKSIGNFVKSLLNWRTYGTTFSQVYKKSPGIHFAVLALLVTFVTGVVGFILLKYFSAARGNLQVVAFMWIITGTLLIITDKRKKNRLGLRQFGVTAAVIVALAQAAALMPGISRSGATICAAILIGLRRRWAVEFSFLIAIPAIMGAALIQLIDNFQVIKSGNLSLASVVIGMTAAAVTGFFALKLLIKTSRAANLKYFAFYCYVLAMLVFIFS